MSQMTLCLKRAGGHSNNCTGRLHEHCKRVCTESRLSEEEEKSLSACRSWICIASGSVPDSIFNQTELQHCPFSLSLHPPPPPPLCFLPFFPSSKQILYYFICISIDVKIKWQNRVQNYWRSPSFCIRSSLRKVTIDLDVIRHWT